ncbi:MAG: flagellar biosynthetic protein FliO [Methylotenera sp.]|uniref:flagellar biosynthetic protein FliO n=1 Tax=Methylotenera sp. TaxID=2051956 RepID=UPI002487342D|nr:flagellar biosynthetic protein FliO [Methylotenera sp.]MDI1308514.1 flagellar biosynthetic protein FliO [Methylotenera sp.]
MTKHHKHFALNILAILSFAPSLAFSAEAVAVSPTGGVLKMVIGLAVVLAVMALITWVLKRMVPGVGNKQSVIRIVGGVSVGSRERVVVLEVAGRWIVVGVASGQVSSLANLESGTNNLAESMPMGGSMTDSGNDGFSNTFASWLLKSTGKILEKKDTDSKTDNSI